jgi:hypothetical protein
LAGLGTDAKSGVATAEAKAFANRSVAALADAIKAGWRPLGLDDPKEPDFDALRHREDFQKLLAELENKAPARNEWSKSEVRSAALGAAIEVHRILGPGLAAERLS